MTKENDYENQRLRGKVGGQIMGFNNVFFENYNPANHPCKDCKDRHVGCHGQCERYKAFNEQRLKKPINLYHRAGKMRDTFHKKGRVIRRGQ